jgi:hypothetical protein
MCDIQVIMEGERYQIPVKPNDDCHWEKLEKEVEQDLENKIKSCDDENLKNRLIIEKSVPLEVRHIRVYDDQGKRKIEYS